MNRFIGVDLAWKTDGNHTGVAVLSGTSGGVFLEKVSEDLVSRTQVVEFVAKHSLVDTVTAIDASIVVPNDSGQRGCETAIGRVYGARGASCHTTNRGKQYWDAGASVVRALERHQYVHDFSLRDAKGMSGRWIFEVYPHPSMIELFGLARRLAYKKGSPAQKREGLKDLLERIKNLPGMRSSLELKKLGSIDLEGLKTWQLKRHEDTLDAVFCGYLAWHCWRWGADRNEMFGSMDAGYIVVAHSH